MPQLGRFDSSYHDPTTGRPRRNISVQLYREGATVSGNQSGSSPFSISVRHRGKIAAADSVFLDTTTGTEYTVDSVTATTVIISGFVGTLNLTNGQRLIPSNNLPTLYSDDQGGATTPNPLTTSALGRAACSMENGAYEVIAGGLLFSAQVIGGEAPSVVYSGESDGASAIAHIEDTRFSMATAGAKLKSFRNLGTEKASIDKDGTGVFPRIGPVSSTTAGGALRIIDGVMFPLTVAGVQAALDECETVGGGTVKIPSAAGIAVTSTSVKIPNRVRLSGHGQQGSTATFIASASTNVSAMVENKTQDGTQAYAYIEHVQINGNKSSGALVTAGLYLKSVYVGSRIKDTLVIGCSGNGIKLDGGAAAGLGQIVLDNIIVSTSNDHNILITGPVSQVYGFQVGSESVAAGKAQIKITNAAASASFGHILIGLNFEGTTAADGLWLDGCSNVQVCGIADDGNGSALNLIKITGSVGGSDGAFAAGGHVILNANANLTTIIDDQVAGVTVGNAQGRFVRWYSSPIASATLDASQIVGLQPARKGVAITAAATITPVQGSSYFVVNGNTGITSITATARDNGRIIVLRFSGTPTITDGSNLIMAGNLVASADDTLTMVCDGTNWVEIARSVN
jgi:hypothetical protein